MAYPNTCARTSIGQSTIRLGTYGTASVYWIAIGIQQWGIYTDGKRNVTITLPIATSVTYAVLAVARTANSTGCTGSQNCQYVSNVTDKTFQAGSYDAGNGYAGFWWLSIGKAQTLPQAHQLKPAYPLPLSYMFAIKLLLFCDFMPKLLLLPLRLLLLLGAPITLYKTLNATGYVTVVSLLTTLLLPHCYTPMDNQYARSKEVNAESGVAATKVNPLSVT